MKAKLFAFLLLSFAVSIVSWSYAPNPLVEEPVEAVQSEPIELPACAGRDTGDARSLTGRQSSHPGKNRALGAGENSLHTAFIELNCLLASN